MRIPDALRVSTDTVWVPCTVSAPRMAPLLDGIVAAVVLGEVQQQASRSCDLRLTPAHQQQFEQTKG